jgi:hypothetical protein
MGAPSMGQFYNQNIKGTGSDAPFDCRTHRLPNNAGHEIQRHSPARHYQKGSDRDCDNIPNVVSKIDHDVRSRRRKLVLSPHCLRLPFDYWEFAAPISENDGGCYDHKLCINFPCVRWILALSFVANWGFLVCRAVAGSKCSTLVKAMPDVDVLLSQITRAKGAAAMIDTAIRKRFELMVGEFQRALDAIEQHPVSQSDSDKN